MDHEICRARIQQLESDLNAAIEREADLELDVAEKDSLISSLYAELMIYRTDREFVA